MLYMRLVAAAAGLRGHRLCWQVSCSFQSAVYWLGVLWLASQGRPHLKLLQQLQPPSQLQLAPLQPLLLSAVTYSWHATGLCLCQQQQRCQSMAWQGWVVCVCGTCKQPAVECRSQKQQQKAAACHMVCCSCL